MELMSRLNWNLEHIWSYFLQMLPCMCLALPIWSCVRPQRYRRLARMGLYSPPSREHALLLFTLFCAGLAALTLFPANFWVFPQEPQQIIVTKQKRTANV